MGTTTSPMLVRIGRVAGAIVLLFVAPLVIAHLLAGPEAAAGVMMGVAAGLAGAMRSGWRRAALVVPLLGVYGVAVAVVGYGWGWVVLMGMVGLIAGIGTPSGYLPALVYAGLVPAVVNQATDVRGAILVGLFALAGGAYGVAAARRLGAVASAPGVARWTGREALAAGLLGGVFAGATAIAVATGLPHGYWVALTLVVVLPPMVQGDSSLGRQRLVGNVAALIIVIPVSAIPMPSWAFYVVGFVLLVPAVVVYRQSYAYYAFFEAAAVVMLVSAGNDVAGTGEARAIASLIAVGIIGVAASLVAWGTRRTVRDSVPAPVLDP